MCDEHRWKELPRLLDPHRANASRKRGHASHAWYDDADDDDDDGSAGSASMPSGRVCSSTRVYIHISSSGVLVEPMLPILRSPVSAWTRLQLFRLGERFFLRSSPAAFRSRLGYSCAGVCLWRWWASHFCRSRGAGRESTVLSLSRGLEPVVLFSLRPASGCSRVCGRQAKTSRRTDAKRRL